MLAALVTVVAPPARGWAGDVTYEQMAPLSRYLMADRQAEVDLARSAAPAAISLHATLLVLGDHGYETAEKGSNGFTCLVERSWMSPFDSAQFWNWKMRGPICYNPAATRTVLLYTLQRTEMALSGLTKSQMLDRTTAAVTDKQLPTPEPGSMSYMMSKDGYLGDAVGPWLSHLMFYAPKSDGAKDGASWGADVPASPVVLDTSHRVVPEPETIFMIPVSHWSDGTLAPAM
ncbi:MAG: hypothetical protein WAK16_08695 [Candidatus Cybelea sp.]